MTSPKSIRVCTSCGHRWSNPSKTLAATANWPESFFRCAECYGLTSTRVPPETADRIAARYQDARRAKLDGPIPAEWAEQDAEAEETNQLMFGGGQP